MTHTILNGNKNMHFNINGKSVAPGRRYEISDDEFAQLLISEKWPTVPHVISSHWGVSLKSMKEHLREHPIDPSLAELEGIDWRNMQALYREGISRLEHVLSKTAEEISEINGISLETAQKWFLEE